MAEGEAGPHQNVAISLTCAAPKRPIADSDPGAPAHQAGRGPLEDGYIVAGPVQERRRRAPGDRSPDNADSHARRPRTRWSVTREVTAIRQRSGHMFPEEADGTGSEGQQGMPQSCPSVSYVPSSQPPRTGADAAGRGTILDTTTTVAVPLRHRETQG